MDSFSRRLGLVEHLFATLHSLGGMLYVNIAHIQGTIPLETLRAAIDFLQKRHPLLQAYLQKSKDSFYFVSDINLFIPLQVIEQEYEEQWLEIAQDEMLRKFSCEAEPLCRIIFLQAKEKTGVSQLIVSFHHAIADGNAALYLIDELLSCCHNLVEGTAIAEIETMPLQLPLEQCLSDLNFPHSAHIGSTPVDSSPTLLIEETTTVEHRKTQLITRIFSQSLTQHLQDRCHQEQTTVHGALCAAMLISVSMETLKTINPAVLSCGSNVDLRASCHPPVAKKQLGCFVSSITTTHDVDLEPNFWELARDCRLSIHQMINSKVPHYQASNSELLKKYQGSFLAQMAEYNAGRSTTIHISNLGKFCAKNESETFRLKEFYFATGQHIVGTCFWLGVVTLNNQTNFTFAYVKPLMSRKMAELLVNNVIMTLENAVLKLL
jgi:hypothetical protein